MCTEKKYEMIKDEKSGLYRIKALRDFSDVKKGDLGGYIERESNLSQYGNCWVYDDAGVYRYSKVYGDAQIRRKAKVFDEARVFGNAYVTDKAYICDTAKVYGYSKVYENTLIQCNANVFGCAEVRGRSIIGMDSEVFGMTNIDGGSVIDKGAKVYGSIMLNNVMVWGKAIMTGDISDIIYSASIGVEAKILSSDDILTIASIGSEDGTLTVYRTADGGIGCTRGCFHGTLDEFEQAVKRTHGDNKFGKQYARAIRYIKEEFGVTKGE